ncbi:hypothetical protein LC087_10345 [Bacillus carboniphilus]|uniref:Uncharacterized protein n=1 Tax=Bacillus carboniphilus TaxID=86663 RepID=A0ABY9JSD6_9BACI|nr:hypothetical protein [Bacillus carboniphilus]WLR41325.1 hypothetical protein LC087_10345 [Bacillus carboniphilus]
MGLNFLNKAFNTFTIARDNGKSGPITDVSLQERKARLTMIEVYSSTTVPAGGSEIIEIKPTDGTIAKVESIFIYVDFPLGGSGTHEIVLASGKNEYHHKITNVKSSNTLRIISNRVDIGSEVNSRTILELQNHFLNTEFDKNIPIMLKYINQTNVDKSKSRYISIKIREEAVTW